MPTVRPRHYITETDEITHALESARRAWPELSDKPTALLRQLILAGEQRLADQARSVDQLPDQLGSRIAARFVGAGQTEDFKEVRR